MKKLENWQVFLLTLWIICTVLMVGLTIYLTQTPLVVEAQSPPSESGFHRQAAQAVGGIKLQVFCENDNRIYLASDIDQESSVSEPKVHTIAVWGVAHGCPNNLR